jgi:hypothetical protein
MLMKQPFFIGGIDDVEVAKGSAFGAAGTFFFTFLVSIIYMIREGRRTTSDIDDEMSSAMSNNEYPVARPMRTRGAYGQVPFQDFDPTLSDDFPLRDTGILT